MHARRIGKKEIKEAVKIEAFEVLRFIANVLK